MLLPDLCKEKIPLKLLILKKKLLKLKKEYKMHINYMLQDLDNK